MEVYELLVRNPAHASANLEQIKSTQRVHKIQRDCPHHTVNSLVSAIFVLKIACNYIHQKLFSLDVICRGHVSAIQVF